MRHRGELSCSVGFCGHVAFLLVYIIKTNAKLGCSTGIILAELPVAGYTVGGVLFRAWMTDTSL